MATTSFLLQPNTPEIIAQATAALSNLTAEDLFRLSGIDAELEAKNWDLPNGWEKEFLQPRDVILSTLERDWAKDSLGRNARILGQTYRST